MFFGVGITKRYCNIILPHAQKIKPDFKKKKTFRLHSEKVPKNPPFLNTPDTSVAEAMMEDAPGQEENIPAAGETGGTGDVGFERWEQRGTKPAKTEKPARLGKADGTCFLRQTQEEAGRAATGRAPNILFSAHLTGMR